jgi:hypothetical protein
MLEASKLRGMSDIISCSEPANGESLYRIPIQHESAQHLMFCWKAFYDFLILEGRVESDQVLMQEIINTIGHVRYGCVFGQRYLL